MRIGDRRQRVASLLGLTLLLTILLASGLNQVEFRPGTVPPFNLSAFSPRPPPDSPALQALLWNLVRVLLFLYLWVVVPGTFAYFLFTRQGRRQWPRILATLAVLGLIAYALLNAPRLEEFVAEPLSLPEDPPSLSLASPTGQVPPPPAWLPLLLSTLGAGVLLGIGRLAYRLSRKPEAPADLIAREAQQALGDLRAGRDFEDTIIRCYYEMTRVLREQRGLRRGAAMTPREFASHLVAFGLPEPAVRRLTRLFERARYGALQATPAESREAEACLTAIATAAREPQ